LRIVIVDVKARIVEQIIGFIVIVEFSRLVGTWRAIVAALGRPCIRSTIFRRLSPASATTSTSATRAAAPLTILVTFFSGSRFIALIKVIPVLPRFGIRCELRVGKTGYLSSWFIAHIVRRNSIRIAVRILDNFCGLLGRQTKDLMPEAHCCVGLRLILVGLFGAHCFRSLRRRLSSRLDIRARWPIDLVLTMSRLPALVARR
jgi:hypothetical protein